jgi:hypothetical protein
MNFRIFEAYESLALNIPYTIMREKTYHNKLFHLKKMNNNLIMKSGKFDGSHKKKNELNFNMRLVSNLKEIQFREIAFNLNFKNFYRLLQKTLRNSRVSKLDYQSAQSCKEYDILFYIHGGGFLAQSTESVLGYLSE